MRAMKENICPDKCWICGRTNKELEQFEINLLEKDIVTYKGSEQDKSYLVCICFACEQLIH